MGKPVVVAPSLEWRLSMSEARFFPIGRAYPARVPVHILWWIWRPLTRQQNIHQTIFNTGFSYNCPDFIGYIDNIRSSFVRMLFVRRRPWNKYKMGPLIYHVFLSRMEPQTHQNLLDSIERFPQTRRLFNENARVPLT